MDRKEAERQVETILLFARKNWPFFDEHAVKVTLNLLKLSPPSGTWEDLKIAYAMAVWHRYRFDWKRGL